MARIKTLLAAAAASLALLAAPAMADENSLILASVKTDGQIDPFEASKARCHQTDMAWCVKVTPRANGATLSLFIEQNNKQLGLGDTVSATVRANGWEGQVNGQTILEKGVTYVFRTAG